MTRKPSRKTDPFHDDIIKWKHFQCYWPFVRGIHQSPVNSPHKGQWRGALIFSLIYAWTNGWVNNRDAGDLRRHHAHYDVTVIFGAPTLTWGLPPQMTSSMEFWCFLGYYPEKAIQQTAGLPVICLPILPSWLSLQTLNTLRPRQNGRHFAEDTFKRIFMNETVRISINISLKFVPNGLINNTPALVQISHNLNQWWWIYWRIYASLGLNELITNRLETLSLFKFLGGKIVAWFFCFHFNIFNPTILVVSYTMRYLYNTLNFWNIFNVQLSPNWHI